MAEVSGARRPPLITASPLLHMAPPSTRHVLRAAPEALLAAGDALELSLSMPVCRASVHGTRAALWLGPDERLLLGDDAWAAASSDRLAQALAGQPHSLVDVSHRQLGLTLSGPHAAIVLATGCPLDLDPQAFPVGMCTRTVFAKAEIVLWRIADDAFHLEVWRSFAAYVSAVIAEGSREMAPPD
jgi:sarcosine oxidase, subunit gamma